MMVSVFVGTLQLFYLLFGINLAWQLKPNPGTYKSKLYDGLGQKLLEANQWDEGLTIPITFVWIRCLFDASRQ